MVNFVKSLIGWIFKPKIIIIGLSLFLLITSVHFFAVWYGMNEIRNQTFKNVKPSIDISYFPLTYKDYLVSQFKNKRNSGYYKIHNREPKAIDSFAYDNYFNTKESLMLLNKLIKKLDLSRKNNKSITTPGLRSSYKFNNYYFYYNTFGNLVYIQTNQGSPYALYDKHGALAQVKIVKNYATYYFNEKKQFIFYCAVDSWKDGYITLSCKDSILYFY